MGFYIRVEGARPLTLARGLSSSVYNYGEHDGVIPAPEWYALAASTSPGDGG